jgi:hypothetical protein
MEVAEMGIISIYYNNGSVLMLVSTSCGYLSYAPGILHEFWRGVASSSRLRSNIVSVLMHYICVILDGLERTALRVKIG